MHSLSAHAITLVQDGKSLYNIVRAEAALAHDIRAAEILQNYLQQISGAKIPIITDATAEGTYELLIGNARKSDLAQSSELREDGFRIQTLAEKISFRGIGKGTLYSVYTFLEKFLNCRKYSSTFKLIPKSSSIILPEIDVAENPPMEIRSLHYFDAETDQEYLDWHKLQRIEDKWGLWGHTFFKLVPPAKYFKEHPEYFSLVNGKREPMQLCLTNPAVMQRVVEDLSLRMKDEPTLEYWSVSQNDDVGACECDNCSSLNDAHGGYQGSLLTFLNGVAAQFPDKTISTLAYTFSRKPPLGIKPLPNANILFSSVEVNRAKPVADDPRSEVFRKDFEDWQSLTSNIIVWDYVVQFSNYFSPFPNLHTLSPNLNYFRGKNLKGQFIQGSVELPGELAELRTFLLAKLLWNPEENTDALQEEFLEAFYGPGSGPIKNYIELVQDRAEQTGQRMDIYDHPIIPFRTYLNQGMLREYLKQFEAATLLSKSDSEMHRRVQIASLPVRFAILEQSRFYGIEPGGAFILKGRRSWSVNKEIKALLDHFLNLAEEFGITQFNETGKTPKQYKKEWEGYLAQGPPMHKALNKPIKFLTQNDDDFKGKGEGTLVDGATGSPDGSYNWLGWYGKDLKVQIDLEEEVKISTVKMSFLENHRYYSFKPLSVKIEWSIDGINFQDAAELKLPAPDPERQTSSDAVEIRFPETSARYVKVTAYNQLALPAWRARKDRKPWLITDEIQID
ncbi:DUF4838 domain-containing protein [Daejeonella sp.]|uniref:DUF4838 domain-containing protein n=1 Tax=Daejeonella sp. TaxID=2805397 RepID=UPI003982E81D